MFIKSDKGYVNERHILRIKETDTSDGKRWTAATVDGENVVLLTDPSFLWTGSNPFPEKTPTVSPIKVEPQEAKAEEAQPQTYSRKIKVPEKAPLTLE